MKPKRDTLTKATLIIGASLIIIGSSFRISHWPGGFVLQLIGLTSMALYTVLLLSQNKKTNSL